MVKLDEHWVTIDGLERYSVSNYGRVINEETGRELTAYDMGGGYLRVTLSRNGRKYKVLLHRLVAKAFFLNYEEGIAVTHINGNKSDCTVLNLTLGEKRCRRGEDVT